MTREPGGTALGARLRALLLDPATTAGPRAEALLYAADRAAARRDGRAAGAASAAPWWSPTATSTPRSPTRAPAATLDAEEVARLSPLGDRRGCGPTSSLLLDVDPEVGLAPGRRTGAPDRLEAESLAFHRRVRQEFLALAGAGARALPRRRRRPGRREAVHGAAARCRLPRAACPTGAGAPA